MTAGPPTKLERAMLGVVRAWGDICVHAPNDRHVAAIRGHQGMHDAWNDLWREWGDRFHEVNKYVCAEEEVEEDNGAMTPGIGAETETP